MSVADIMPLLMSISSRLQSIEDRLGLESGANQGTTASTEVEVPRSVRGFDSYCTDCLNPFVAACDKLGGDAKTGGDAIRSAWEEMRSIVLIAATCKEPAQKDFHALLGKLTEKMKAVGACVNRNTWEKHTKTLSEGVGCLNWILVKPAPRDFIESFIGGSDYWANNIRKEFRTTNPDQIAFCDTFKALISQLMPYVKEYHTTGLTWNARGIDVSEYSATAAAPSAPAAKPAATTTTTAAAAAAATTATAATSAASVAVAPTGNLFAALSKGEAITSGLKTVTKDMQTWRAEYKGTGSAPAAAAAGAKASAPAVVKASAVKGPPKLAFQSAGCKWVVENQTEAGGLLEINIEDKKQTVYIFGCVGATVQIHNKCKSIVVDSCKKCKVIFDAAMASCEVVNCQRMEIRCLEKIAAVAIDKTDGIVVYLPVSSLDTEVVASKSSEMNLSWPDANGDMVERPIPEQYVHRINGMSITADVSDLYGH